MHDCRAEVRVATMSRPLYDRIGIGYSDYRRPDPRIAEQIGAALGASRTVLNVGAGTGAYEPGEGSVVAVEPSIEMLRQRSVSAAPAVQASADRLPFRSDACDAALAVLTIHHWPDPQRGLAEMRRVARDRVVVLTWDPDQSGFWLLRDYFPEILEIDRKIFPRLAEIEAVLGPIEVRTVEIPNDCTDGFLGAYWRRPEAYLDARVRRAISTFSKLSDVAAGLGRLRDDLATGAWQRQHAQLMTLPRLDLGYRLVIAR